MAKVPEEIKSVSFKELIVLELCEVIKGNSTQRQAVKNLQALWEEYQDKSGKLSLRDDVQYIKAQIEEVLNEIPSITMSD